MSILIGLLIYLVLGVGALKVFTIAEPDVNVDGSEAVLTTVIWPIIAIGLLIDFISNISNTHLPIVINKLGEKLLDFINYQK